MIFLWRTRHVASIVTLVALFGAWCALIDAQQGNPNTDRQDPTDAQTPSAQTPNVGINQAAPAPAEPRTTNDQEQPNRLRQTFLERLIDPVTWFTALLFGVGWFQLRAMRRQVAYMRDGLVITKVAADAAKLSADIARDALHLAERADLVIQTISAMPPVPFALGTVITLVFKNFGRTRANEVMIHSWMGINDSKVHTTSDNPVPNIVAAGAFQHFGFYFLQKCGFTKETCGEINAREKVFRIGGIVTYIDVFEKPHKVEFQGRWRPSDGVFSPEINRAD